MLCDSYFDCNIARTLIERALEIQKDVYLCFIDYTKAFDRVRHDEIIKELRKLKIDGKDLRIIKNMYWEQTAAMRVEGEISAFQKIKRGVRQGCVLSPDLFSLYSEIIMRNIEGQPGIRVGGHNINNLRYADDTVLISENEKDLQQLLNIVESKSKEKWLELNSKKTEVMVISRKEEPPLINITINGIKLKQRDHFKYLGALISSDGRNNTEISARIAQAKMTFQKMKTVLTNSHISIHTRKQCFQSSAFLRKSAIFVLPGNFCTWFSNFRKKKSSKKIFFSLKFFFREKKKKQKPVPCNDFPQTKWRLNSPAQEEQEIF